jgi:hypothetical protein
MALLDGLDAVHWSRLRHAYGPATDVPGLLRALVDPVHADPHLQERARRSGRSVPELVQSDLYSNVIHQNSVWSATSKVVPFFVEILTAGPRDKELRRFALEYLAALSDPDPEEPLLRGFDPDERYAGFERPRHWREEHDEDDDEMGGIWAKECYEGVERALPQLIALYDDDDDELAIAAMHLVARFPRQVDLTTPRLREIALSSAPARRGAALVSLALLDPTYAHDLAEGMIDRVIDRLSAFHAAAAAVIADPTRASMRTKEIIASPVDDFADAPSLIGDIARLREECLMILRCAG